MHRLALASLSSRVYLATRTASLMLLGSLGCLFGLAQAGVPLPDHMLYGTIAIDGRPVTKADTTVVVEARRSPGGPVVASYRMGSLARLGDYYYSLRLPVASASDATPTQAILGESITLTVRSASRVAFQLRHDVTEPGVALRLDFGAGIDTDGDGVPEGWELANLGASSGNLDRDTDGDGAADRTEYFAGTKPTDATDVLRLALVQEGANLQVSFRALRAAGTGFEGRTRYYALQSTTDPAGGQWLPVENFSRVPGNDQLLTYVESGNSRESTFFRVRVWLE